MSSVWSEPEAFHVSGDSAELPSVPLSTRTVFGFLDFVTTVSDTVMIFTSQGGESDMWGFTNTALSSVKQVLETHPFIVKFH